VMDMVAVFIIIILIVVIVVAISFHDSRPFLVRFALMNCHMMRISMPSEEAAHCF